MVAAFTSRLNKKFYFLTILIVLASIVAISTYHLSWLRESYAEDIEAQRVRLLNDRERDLSTLVDLVISWIDEERRLERAELLKDPTADVVRRADEIVRKRIGDRLRTIRFTNGSYFWVNEILDYAGGYGYAVRRVWPRDPGLEGSLLSTESQDMDGEFPFLRELLDLTERGVSFYSYSVSKTSGVGYETRICLAKLYRDFNWVIATDLDLSDVEAALAVDRARMLARFWHQLVVLLVSSAIVLIAAVVLTVLAAQRSYRAMRELAEHDQLTGLLNRRVAQDRLMLETARSVRGHGHFCVVICDLDHFKKVNDTFGHPVGDIVLRSVANILRRELRATDLASRWGGEEFLLVLDNSRLSDAVIVAERIRLTIQREPIVWEGQSIALTLTLGVGEYDGREEPADFLRRVDNALYRGKDAGRNQVMVAEPEPFAGALQQKQEYTTADDDPRDRR